MKNTKTTYNKYPAYKHSGVDWLGEIPEHWEILANKYIFSLKKRQVGKNSKKYTLLSLTLNGIIVRDMINPQGKFPAEFDTYQEVKQGDFVFCLFEVEETPRAVGLSDFDGMITGAYTVMRSNENFDKRFLYYFYLNLDYGKRLKPLYTGLRNIISKDNFFAYKTYVPPKSEQTSIAQFLDHKTAQIDKAISNKEKLIRLLKEHKQIMIQELVTGKKVWNKEKNEWTKPSKTKDSGVDWIGEIPEGWQVKRLKYVADYIQTGTTPYTSNPEFFDGEINWYNPKDLNNEILINSEKTVSVHAIKKNEIKMFLADSILIVGIGATTGKTAYMTNSGTFNQQITGFHSKKHNNKYLFYLLKSFANVMLKVASYTTLPILNNEFFKSFPTVVPTKNEQQLIVNHIETQSSQLDRSISLQQSQIEKLKEYKASLIDSVVRGKIRITGIEALEMPVIKAKKKID